MARWLVSATVFVGFFTSCAHTTKPPEQRAVARLRRAAAPPSASSDQNLDQPHRFLLTCFEQITSSWPRPADQLERDRQALVATFLCLFGHPRSANAGDVSAFVLQYAQPGMPAVDRLRLVAGLGHLWGIRFRLERDRVLFLRDMMRPGYQGVDGVVFAIDGKLISINFYRIIDRDQRSNEL